MDTYGFQITTITCMKRHFLFFTTSLFLLLITVISCTEKGNPLEEVKPGSFTIEKMVQAIKDDAESRGINNSNTGFDVVYDPDYIYLHIVGSEETVYIPLYTVQCAENTKCKCFRYHIDVYEDGHAKLTPIIDQDGTLASESLTIPNGSSCYFSSVAESVWKLEDDQIYRKTKHVLYKQKEGINKEIYRSIENFSITQLTNNIDELLMGRACAAFTVVGLFYDAERLNNTPIDPILPFTIVPFTDSDFFKIMGSNPDKWYIKIYIGGSPFVSGYNLGTQNLQSDNALNDNGYYCTGPFTTNESDKSKSNNQFVPFSLKYHGLSGYYLQSWGYQTDIHSRLLTPVLNDKEKILNVYILIKHWEGEGQPTLEWLTDDSDALYTRMNITGEIYPYNNCFYTMGLLMDIRQFKKIWDEKQSSRSSVQSRTTNGMHYFELKDAKVIVEKY